jgi:hypothetical protein
MTRLKNERGAVLLVAIIGIIVAGALVTALVTVSVMDHREGRNTRSQTQAFGVAENGLNEMVGNWNSGSWNSMPVGDSVTVNGTTAGGSGSYDGVVKKLNNNLFIVSVAGSDATSGARQRVGAFVRLRTIEMDIRAALTTRGPTNVGGTSQISGFDQAPAGWAGCPPDSDLAGVRLPDIGDLNGIGSCNSLGCIGGVPSVDPDPAVGDSTFFTYGDMDWQELISLANKLIPAGTYQQILPSFLPSGSCDFTDMRNWGDPLNPTSLCGGYFPIIYVSGNLVLNTGQGQGILMVEGDLTVNGGFEFFGIVIVRGSLSTAGTGGHFNGAVLAANVNLDNNAVLGDALVQYSQCAKAKALTNAAPGRQLRSRGWLYSY